MRNILQLFALTIITTGSIAAGAAAADPSARQADRAAFVRSIRIAGRANATVNAATVRLSDIAEISSPLISDGDAIIGLQKITIERSPSPGTQATIVANTVLERLRAEGVDLTQLTYTLPRVITVTRAGRALGVDEVRTLIERYWTGQQRDVVLKSIDGIDRITVTPALGKIEAIPLNSTRPGQQPFTLRVVSEDQEEQRFKISATFEEWGETPIAKRVIGRGSVIGIDDVAMARMNLNALPGDAARDIQSVVGLETKNDIGFGEVLRRNKLLIPPVVSVGSRVVLKYRTPLFEASALGLALDSGITGQEIRVRNSSSQKVVFGTVIEPGVVAVKLQQATMEAGQ